MARDRVLVVMSSYNGEKYIREQITSILDQTDVDVTLLIRDDGSGDRTRDIISEIIVNHSNIRFIEGDNIGFRMSFFNTLVDAEDEFDYYAFSDQDDVWDYDKLITAIRKIKELNRENTLYTSALRVVDQDLNYMYDNQFKKLRISLGSAISRQRLAGCTMVFDRTLKRKCNLFSITQEMGNIISHDGAVYYICLLTGGSVIFDENSHISFRRHKGTVTEHGQGIKKRIQSVTSILHERSGQKYKQVKILSEVYGDCISQDNQALVDEILSYKQSLRSTIKLSFDRKVRCGIAAIDLINWIAIITRHY